MSQGDGQGLFSHDTVPLEVSAVVDNAGVHHRPVFSAADDAVSTSQENGLDSGGGARPTS
ncbi:hypothetical protein [Nocardia sp. NPDC052566]|uniref:hypothetical protein n=1 Tax=Nocardia sp. NPDC052566 TaxID=3364330 RepID=UPI0037C9B408